jgi:hypothetical protein
MAACGAVQGHSALGQGLVVSRLASIEIDFIALLLIGYGAIRVSDDPNLEGKAKWTSLFGNHALCPSCGL